MRCVPRLILMSRWMGEAVKASNSPARVLVWDEAVQCALRAAERRMGGRRLIHFRIAIRIPAAVKVESPYVEPRIAHRVAQRVAVEPMGDRECRRKRRAVNIDQR